MVETLEGSVAISKKTREYVEQLFMNVYLSPERQAPKTLAIASAESGEGRTSIALSLGIQVRATLSESVLIIEANLRNPGLAKLVGIPKSDPGLSDILSGNLDSDKVIKSLGSGLCDVLPAGKIDDLALSSKLINRQNLQDILNNLAGKYEYIVLETAPLNRFPEAQLIAGLVDGVVLAVKAGSTSRESTSLAMKKIESAGGKIFGIVLNQKQFHLPNWLYKRL